MPIAQEKYFTKEHIKGAKGKAPLFLAEQAVHSLELVAQLVTEGLQFRFKGGNSLLVLLEEPKRFSIDVDISTDESRERIDECLARAVKKHGVFKRWQRRQHKTKPWLPMTSYEIFFNSHFATPDQAFIMLDAILHNTRYVSVKKTVACDNIYRSNVMCELPSVSSILGDKMLTLGPNTLGIPVGKKKEAQRLKHVHDVSLLASKRPDITQIKQSIRLCMEQELKIQERELSLQQVFDDTMAFCRIPALYEKPPRSSSGNAIQDEIVAGLGPFSSHLFANDYSWHRLQTDAARAAACFAAAKIDLGDNKSLWQVLDQPEMIKQTQANTSPKMKKLKELNPPAWACWDKVHTWTGKQYL